MNQRELLGKLEAIIQDAKTGVLATVDSGGWPHMRWMTPAVLRDRPGAIFAVTSPAFAKMAQLDNSPQVEWMIQTRALDEVINVRGEVNVVDNPSLKREVMEQIGRRLTVFWKASREHTDFVVLETVIEEARYYLPMLNQSETVSFEPSRE